MYFLRANSVLTTSFPILIQVILDVVLYLKLNKSWNCCEVHKEKKVEGTIDILNHDRSGKQGRDACIQLMLESDRDLGEIFFTRPLHLRIKKHH